MNQLTLKSSLYRLHLIIFCFLSLICAFSMTLDGTEIVSEKEAEAPKTSRQVPEFPSKFDPNQSLFPVEENREEEAKQNDRFMSELVNMVATLGLIIALLLVIAWFLKRLMSSRVEQLNVTSAIKILEKRILSQKSSLYLIEFNEKTLLIAESQNGVLPLAEVKSSSLSLTESSETSSAFQKLVNK